MSLRPRSRLSWALVASAALAVSLLPATAASAGSGTKSSSFSATISPTIGQAGQRSSFTLTFTNDATSSNGIGAIQILVPAGFTVQGVTPPTGFVYSYPVACSSDSPGYASGACAAGTLVQVNAPNNGAQKINATQTATVTIQATLPKPSTITTYPWQVAAKNSAAWSNGLLFQEDLPGDPQVTVIPAPTHLTIDSARDPDNGPLLSTNKPFDVMVTARDDAGNPEPYSGTITLSASGGVGTIGTLTFPPGTTPAAPVQVTLTGSSSTTLSVVYTGFANGITLTAHGDNLSPDATLSISVNKSVATATGTPGTAISPSQLNIPGADANLVNGATGTVSLVSNTCAGATYCSSGLQFDLNGSFKDASGNPLYGFGTSSSPLKPAGFDWICPAVSCPHADISEEPSSYYNYWGNDERQEEYSSFPLYVSLREVAPNGDVTYTPFAQAPTCVPLWNYWTTGQIVTSQAQSVGFCVDVNAISRANNSFTGDLKMPVLFVEDPIVRSG